MKKVCLLAAGLFLLAGCSTTHNVHNTVDATGFNFMAAKKGTDCKYSLLGLLPLSKTDIDKAAQKANIRSLGYVEYSHNYYVLYSEDCVVVYGK